MIEEVKKVLEKFVEEHVCKKNGIHNWFYWREGSAVFRKCIKCKREQGLRIINGDAVWLCIKEYREF